MKEGNLPDLQTNNFDVLIFTIILLRRSDAVNIAHHRYWLNFGSNIENVIKIHT